MSARERARPDYQLPLHWCYLYVVQPTPLLKRQASIDVPHYNKELALSAVCVTLNCVVWIKEQGCPFRFVYSSRYSVS